MRASDKRKHIVFMLYLAEFYDRADVDEAVDTYLGEWVELDGIRGELKAKYSAVSEKIGVIDPMIAAVSEGWRLSRMAKVDLAIMRNAVYEMFYVDDIASAVAISEAVILAKEYGGEESSVFINGILGKLERNRLGNE